MKKEKDTDREHLLTDEFAEGLKKSAENGVDVEGHLRNIKAILQKKTINSDSNNKSKP